MCHRLLTSTDDIAEADVARTPLVPTVALTTQVSQHDALVGYARADLDIPEDW
jgi:hypothetical protein